MCLGDVFVVLGLYVKNLLHKGDVELLGIILGEERRGMEVVVVVVLVMGSGKGEARGNLS